LAILPPAAAEGGFGARDVILELRVDDLRARHPLVRLEHERAGTGIVGDLLERVGGGDVRRHDERHVGGDLADRLEHQAVRLLSVSTTVLSSAATRLSVTPISCWPMPSRAPQRFSEATRRSR
jgi:hypothetical protein